MKKFTISSLLLILGLIAGALHAQILHVPADFTTIQAAVDAAGYGDTVLVAPGTYQENIRIQGNAKVLTLASNFIFSADTNDINNTIIDASQPTNVNYGMGILIKSQDTTIMPKITGFTITGGTGYYKTYGGGIYSSNAIPVIEYNHIQDCSITGTQPNGAGIYVGSYWHPDKVCIIYHNVIKNNTITTTPNAAEGVGGGMALSNVKVIIEDNKISGNVIIGGSTTNGFGGGIFYFENMPANLFPFISLKNNEITDNTIESFHAAGGGVLLTCNDGFSTDTLEGNMISHNEVKSTGSDGYALGGGVEVENPNEGSLISSNIISDNKAFVGPFNADRSGGGIYLWRSQALPQGGSPVVEKNRITGNSAFDGAGITCQSIGVRLQNNFISGNEAEIRGGAVFFYSNEDTSVVAEIANNTVVSNSVIAQSGVAGSFDFDGLFNVLLMNNIFYGNHAAVADEIRIVVSTVQINNCDLNTDEIDGDWTGKDNFYSDPEFVDEMNWDCFNHEAPCSETGTDEVFAFNRYFDAPVDDFSGNPRPQGDFVDVGAVEINVCWVGVTEVSSRQSAVSSYPNPTSSRMTFEYSLEESAVVTLKLFNQVGQQVAVPVNEQQTSGDHQVQWNAEGMPAGVYFYTLTAGKQAYSGKVIVLE
jgi:hypothetical protein